MATYRLFWGGRTPRTRQSLKFGEDNRPTTQYARGAEPWNRHVIYHIDAIRIALHTEDVLVWNCEYLFRWLARIKQSDERVNCSEAYSKQQQQERAPQG